MGKVGRDKACAFVGKSDDELSINQILKLASVIKNSIISGTKYFLFGEYPGFESVCYKIISDYKNEFKDIKRILVLEDENWDKENFGFPSYLTSKDYDNIIYIKHKNTNWYRKLYTRKLMIDSSDTVIINYQHNDPLEIGNLCKQYLDEFNKTVYEI